MDGGDEQAFLRSLDISANLNQEVRDVEEDVVLFQNQFLTCTVILTGDGKGMQAMGGAGSKCWLCKDPNGIVEQRGVESTSRWGAFLRSVTPDRRPGDYQHAACRILNGIAKHIETTLQALPPGTRGKAQALAALQAFKQALKDETSGIPLRERLPSASRATEKDFDLTSTKFFLTSPPFQRQFVDCLKEHVPTVRTPGGPLLWVVVHVMVKCIEGLYELWRVREMYTLTQVERHRALTTKISKAWGDSGWSPILKWRVVFAFSGVALQSFAKLCGRTLRLLLNELYASVHITSIALPVMMGVRDLVQAVSRIQTSRSRVEPIEIDIDDMYWELGKDTCMDAIRFAIRINYYYYYYY